MFGRRILLLIPHPDDEVVGCAATIKRAKTDGSQIFALYLTHGCIARQRMWRWERKKYDALVARRRAEGEKAAAFLGITPLGWSDRPARHIRFAMNDVYEEIALAIASQGCDQIWTPTYEGGNADHDAVNALASVFASQINVLEFAEYNFSGGHAHSQEFPKIYGTETSVTLSPTEQQKKRMALAIYASERGNLDYVHTQRECFRPLVAYDYSQPPHKGTLWYTRFQWVPFRHPRVDFTHPQDVSRAITSFLSQPAAPRAPQARVRM
jgi:LmbE family N-acetylglucosaminyl deacetylase